MSSHNNLAIVPGIIIASSHDPLYADKNVNTLPFCTSNAGTTDGGS
jgi:hypothetical protein